MSDNRNDSFTVEKAETLFRSAATVKDNSLREVRRTGDYFIKFDRRPGHGFAKEFAIAHKLRQAGIPVVDHIFYGRNANGNYLVTSAFAGGIDVASYLRKHRPPRIFFERISDLLTAMLSQGFLHTDLHMGNLLYNPDTDAFALVDVRKVSQMPRWALNSLPESTRFHALFEFRRVLRRSELNGLFHRAGIANPGAFYETMLAADNARLREEWPRRRKQILSGYLKFTRLEEDALCNVNAAPDEIASAVAIPGGKAVFLAEFFLDLAMIPHRKVVKYVPATDQAYAVPECSANPGGEAAIEMMTRLNFYDIASTPADWCQPDAGLPQLRQLDRVARESFILGK